VVTSQIPDVKADVMSVVRLKKFSDNSELCRAGDTG